jgi:hypothetical protein
MLAYGSRHVLISRSRVLGAISRVGTPAMGVALLLIGVLTVTGIDKRVETTMVDHMP